MQRSNDLHVGEDVQCWDEEHAKTLGRVFEHGNERAAVAAAFKIYSEVQVVNANPAANYRVQQDRHAKASGEKLPLSSKAIPSILL